MLTYCTMRDVWSQLKALAEVDTRIAEVETFNQVWLLIMSALFCAEVELLRAGAVSGLSLIHI